MIPAISLQFMGDLKKEMKGWNISPLVPTRTYDNKIYQPYWNTKTSYHSSFIECTWKKFPNHASQIEEYLQQIDINSEQAAILLKPPHNLSKGKKNSQYPLRLIVLSLDRSYTVNVVMHLARGYKPDPNNSSIGGCRKRWRHRMPNVEVEYHRAIHEGHTDIQSFETREIQTILPKEGRKRPSVHWDLKINIAQEIIMGQTARCIKAILEESYRAYSPHHMVVERFSTREPYLPIILK